MAVMLHLEDETTAGLTTQDAAAPCPELQGTEPGPGSRRGRPSPAVRWLPFPGGPPELLLALSPRLGTQRKAAAYRGSMGFQLPGLGPPVTGPAAPRPPA